MKKIFIFLYFLGAVATLNAQITVNVFATGATGSFTCGHSSTAARTDGSVTFRSTSPSGTDFRGYAVFDLSSIPTTAIVSSVVIGYTINTHSGAGSTTNTYGYAGDLSTVTVPATLYANMVAGTLINTTNWGATTGNFTLPSNAGTVGFVQGQLGNKISICFTEAGGTNIFWFSGETATAATTGTHAPFITVTYTCPTLAGLNAVATPNPICAGKTLHLSGGGTGATAFTWIGPAAFSGTTAIDSVPAIVAGDAGVYTLVTTDIGNCHDTVRTAAVVVNPNPAPFTGLVTPLCAGINDTMTETTTGGTWAVFPTTIGILGSVSATKEFFEGTNYTLGTATISYTLPTGCYTTTTITVNPIPAPITGGSANDTACMGQTFTLADTSLGGLGSWTSVFPAFATVSTTGVVNALTAGTTIIRYSNPITGCGPQSFTLTVAQEPSFIHGNYHLCVASVDSLTDTISGGIWTSSDPLVGTVATYAGWLTGYTPGNAVITYTLPGNCYRTFDVLVTGAPGSILNANSTCPGYTFSVSDSTPYGTWSSSTPSVAGIISFDSVTGTVHAFGVGTTILTYSSCGYDTTVTLVVNPRPNPIMGKDSVCVGDTIMMYDSTNFGIWQSKYDTVATAAAAFGIVTGIAHGVDTVYYRLSDGCYTKKYIYVDTLPARITGINNICPFNPVTLADLTAGGKWHSRYPNIAKVDSNLGKVTGLIAGYDTIMYRAGIGCKAFFPITVNPRPAPIVGDSIMCTYDSLYVTDLTPNGHWSSSNVMAIVVDSLTGDVNTVDTSKDSSYIVYTLGVTGCSDSLKIVKHAAPHPIIYYNGGLGEGYTDSIYLGHHIRAYQWYDSTTVGAIPGAISCALAFLYNEAYFVLVTDTFGCKGRSETYFNSTAGVANIAENKIVVYPNPVSSKLHILSAYPVDAEITNEEGRKVGFIKHAGSIDVASYTPGVYFVTLFDEAGNKVLSQQFIKE